VAAYSSTGRGVAITYSNDRGRTFTEYNGNPVDAACGDPKVIWHEQTKKWIMIGFALAPGDPPIWDNYRAVFYSSDDLKNWKFESKGDFFPFVECPELFELAVDGNKQNTKWVTYQGSGVYFIGNFDGSKFAKYSGPHKYVPDNGCYYASQTFNNMPQKDGRRIQMAWGRIDMPEMPFHHMVLFPVVLTLRTTDDGIRMFAEPVNEIETLHQQTWKYHNQVLKPKENPLENIKGELFHIKAKLYVNDSERCGFTIRDVPIIYNVKKQELTCNGKSAPLKPVDGKIVLELIVDRMSIEIFANGGCVYMPMGINLTDNQKRLGVFTEAGNVKLESLEVYALKSIW
jgi:fructan beta-fructosidase